MRRLRVGLAAWLTCAYAFAAVLPCQPAAEAARTGASPAAAAAAAAERAVADAAHPADHAHAGHGGHAHGAPEAPAGHGAHAGHGAGEAHAGHGAQAAHGAPGADAHHAHAEASPHDEPPCHGPPSLIPRCPCGCDEKSRARTPGGRLDPGLLAAPLPEALDALAASPPESPGRPALAPAAPPDKIPIAIS